jgi:acetoin utilization deacetylase AcuC-like enzyme
MTQKLMNVAAASGDGRIVSSLEGGYNLSALARSVGVHLKTLAQFSLLGDPSLHPARVPEATETPQGVTADAA